MATDSRTSRRFLAVRRQLRLRAEQPTAGLNAAHDALAYLAWMCGHCRDFAAVPSFLDAACSDVVTILYACTAGLERSAYLHGRSILENLVRHCYFDSRPSLFVARHLAIEDGVRDRWADLFARVRELPHFHPASRIERGHEGESGEPANGEETSTSQAPADDQIQKLPPLFADLQAVYQDASRFIHGSTPSYRSLYEGIQSIGLDEPQTKALGTFLRRLSEHCLLLLALYHIGPYLLVSQPVRRHMLRSMRAAARGTFLRAMENVPLEWARHHRTAALTARRERRRAAIHDPNGLLLEKSGRLLIVNPDMDR